MSLKERETEFEQVVSEVKDTLKEASSIHLKDISLEMLQKLMVSYRGLFLAKEYETLGDCIDKFQNSDENTDDDFFGKIRKTGGGPLTRGSVGADFANRLRGSYEFDFMKKDDFLYKLYGDLWGLYDGQVHAEFSWNNTIEACSDLDFENLLQVTPSTIYNPGWHEYFISEANLRKLLQEKEIPESDYSISYGKLLSPGRVIFLDDPVDRMWSKEYAKENQKGLYIHRSPRRNISTSQK